MSEESIGTVFALPQKLMKTRKSWGAVRASAGTFSRLASSSKLLDLIFTTCLHGRSLSTDSQGALVKGLGRACVNGTLLYLDIASVHVHVTGSQTVVDDMLQRTVVAEVLAREQYICGTR